MKFEFTGKTILITGGARGIGYAAATIFAQSGANVAIADINGDLARESATRLAKYIQAKTIGIQVDVTK